jgi:transposase
MRELSVTEQRYQAVMAVIGDGLSISQVAEKVGVSRQTLHAWLARSWPRSAPSVNVMTTP